MVEARATLANWRSAPHNRWAFHHVRELVPSADIPNDQRRVRELPSQPLDFALDQFLEETSTDGIAILHRGRIVFERYANGMTPQTPHILMSVSKSMLGLLASMLDLPPDRLVTDFVPELAQTAYRGASVRDLLDMRAGIAFNEDYLATSGPIVEYRKATGWNPLAGGEQPSDLHSFLTTLKEQDGPHGGPMHYVSPNSDLLGWVVERATGRRYAELMSETLWKAAGAERSAYVTVDRLGAPRCAGGMCVTLRDLARVGQWMIEARSGFLDDIGMQGDARAWAAGDMAVYFPGLPIRYRSQWYMLEGEAPLYFGYGIHGQFLYVDPRNELVVVKLSSQALPMDTARIGLAMRAVSEIRKFLAAA
ncbi:MAG: serine hydrolase [Betaproteobacteria bacterium RIFCSPLOWO2_12_FULL_65_14]|nr:MAG: serine hydrolase [Betaproteobacteria bacterium RIFCSPLOWO2_12_FULL_65_14]